MYFHDALKASLFNLDYVGTLGMLSQYGAKGEGLFTVFGDVVCCVNPCRFIVAGDEKVYFLLVFMHGKNYLVVGGTYDLIYFCTDKHCV